MKNSIYILFFLLLVCSCEKEAGEGGTSSIVGSVYKISTYYNVLTQQNDTVYYQLDSGEDIYIIYSDNENDFYDDNIETNWNGQYRFDYLRKGDYIVFIYADSTDNLNVSYDYPIFHQVTIPTGSACVRLYNHLLRP